MKILYDNQAAPGFHSGWGFSALVEPSLLFDVGEKAEPLLANIRKFGISLEQVRRVVLSHEHWDHVGGLDVLAECGGVDVYLPRSFSGGIKGRIRQVNDHARIVEVGNDLELADGVIVTRELSGDGNHEISAAVRTPKGLVLLVGCSHPGLDTIMENASRYGDIHAVIGGFHGFSNLEALSRVDVIVPTHCTQHKQEIQARYPEKTRRVAAGSEIRFE